MSVAAGTLIERARRAAARGGRSCIRVLPALLIAATHLGAQPAQQSSGISEASAVKGRVVRPATHQMLGVPGLWVTLHRVGPDTAGPLDSLRTDTDGRYLFRYRRTGAPDAVYFASATYRGITYLSRPLRAGIAGGDTAEIDVFDTTSAAMRLQVSGRHIVIGAAQPRGNREVQEVYEVSNDSSVTFVSPDDAHPTFAAPLPRTATSVRGGQGDVSPASIRAARGRVEVVAPFAPGIKQLSFGYDVPPNGFPMRIAIDRPIAVLEVLTEDTVTRVRGATLRAVAPVAVEGRTFLRYLAHDVPVGATIVATVPRARGDTPTQLGPILAVVVGALLAAVVVLIERRRPTLAPSPDAELLARRIAQADAEFAARQSPSDTERAAHEASRADLERSLARALDASAHRE